jgi:predicted DsbA family dithiol-disulfide isomerase
MKKVSMILFTSPTCPHCYHAKENLKRLLSERSDFEFSEVSIATDGGRQEAARYEVNSTPTFIIKGPGYPHNIGLRGNQPVETLKRYLDMAKGAGKPI